MKDISYQTTIEEAFQYRLKSEALLSRISSLFIGLLADEIDPGIISSLGDIGEFFGFDRCCFYRLAPHGKEVSLTHEWNSEGAAPGKDFFTEMPREGRTTVLGRMTCAGHLHIHSAGDLPEDPVLRSYWRDRGLSSLLLMPLTQYGEVYGFLGFESSGGEKRCSEVDYPILRMTGEVFLAALQRKKTEEFTGNILASLGEGVVVIDRNYRIITANREYCAQAGMSPHEVKGRTCHEVSHHCKRPCHENGVDCVLVKTIETGFPQRVLHNHVDADGNPHHTAVKSYPMRDSEGNIRAVVAITNNITEKIILEQQLDQAKSMQIIGKLVAGVAHEVRTPLYVILSMTEIIARKLGNDPELKPFLSQISGQVNALSSLMNDLLDCGKPVEKINLQRVSLPDLCSSLIGSWQHCQYGKTHNVRMEMKGRTGPVYVRADVQRIQRVFQNLLENAAQHSPEGSEIELVLLSDGKSFVKVRVVDQGTGIRENHLDRVLEPFFSTRRGGTGLGLSIVKHIVEAHGGSIALRNNDPQPGCTVELTLPRAPESDA